MQNNANWIKSYTMLGNDNEMVLGAFDAIQAPQAKHGAVNSPLLCILNITSCVALENLYCTNIASFFLRILSCLNRVRELSFTYVRKEKFHTGFHVEKQLRKWKRGNHTHRLMTQEKMACVYRTENYTDYCHAVEYVPCIQLSLCHSDCRYFSQYCHFL